MLLFLHQELDIKEYEREIEFLRNIVNTMCQGTYWKLTSPIRLMLIALNNLKLRSKKLVKIIYNNLVCFLKKNEWLYKFIKYILLKNPRFSRWIRRYMKREAALTSSYSSFAINTFDSELNEQEQIVYNKIRVISNETNREKM